MKVGVVGASGYTGEVLVQLLLKHPAVELAVVTSRAHAGKPLSAVIPALRGADRGLRFVDSDAGALAASDCALFFLALPHGAAADYARRQTFASRTWRLTRAITGSTTRLNCCRTRAMCCPRLATRVGATKPSSLPRRAATQRVSSYRSCRCCVRGWSRVSTLSLTRLAG